MSRQKQLWLERIEQADTWLETPNLPPYLRQLAEIAMDIARSGYENTIDLENQREKNADWPYV